MPRPHSHHHRPRHRLLGVNTPHHNPPCSNLTPTSLHRCPEPVVSWPAPNHPPTTPLLVLPHPPYHARASRLHHCSINTTSTSTDRALCTRGVVCVGPSAGRPVVNSGRWPPRAPELHLDPVTSTCFKPARCNPQG